MVPVSLRPYKWAAHHVRSLCEADPEFAKFALNADINTFQYIALTIWLWLRQKEEYSIDQMAEMILTYKRTETIQNLTVGYAQPALKVVSKIGPEALPHGHYGILLKLLRDAKTAGLLRHWPRQLDARTISLIDALDVELRAPNFVMGRLDHDDLHEFRYFVAMMQKVRPDVPRKRLVQSLASIGSKVHWLE